MSIVRSDNAKAQFYPDVNLTAFVGYQILGPGSLITAGNREIGVGPAVRLRSGARSHRRAG